MSIKKTILYIIVIALMPQAMMPISNVVEEEKKEGVLHAEMKQKLPFENKKYMKKIIKKLKVGTDYVLTGTLLVFMVTAGIFGISCVVVTTYALSDTIVKIFVSKPDVIQRPFFLGKTPYDDFDARDHDQLKRDINRNYPFPQILSKKELEKMPGVPEDKIYEFLKPLNIQIAEQYGSLGAVEMLHYRNKLFDSMLKKVGFSYLQRMTMIGSIVKKLAKDIGYDLR